MGGIKIKLNKIAILSLLMMLLCFIGTASATEDINDTVVAESTLDDNSVSIDNVDDSNDDIQTIKNLDDDLASENSKISSTSGTPTTAYDWNTLKNKCEAPTSQYITLTGTTYTIGEVIKFKNSATIVGSNVSYITGGSTSKTPFLNINPALTLHFINVKFLNVNANNLLQLDGTVYLENCTFNNIQTATGRNSVIYNTNNLMYISGCNITNCNTGYGAVSNYVFGSTTSVVMYVDDCNFVNNSASVEPGAINNCGILYVNNTLFDGNHANWWAGAIHTHTNAQTEIQNSIFKRNTAGWNGGALYTYSKLKIYNSTFENNNCTTNNGGGAIGAYNYGSEYNITIDSCRFNYNKNLCEAYTNISTTSLGRGGAISVLNGGYLTVCNSNFTGNYARIGQAIAAATYTYENGTGGNPHIKICHNLFVNHTATGIDTVALRPRARHRDGRRRRHRRRGARALRHGAGWDRRSRGHRAGHEGRVGPHARHHADLPRDLPSRGLHERHHGRDLSTVRGDDIGLGLLLHPRRLHALPGDVRPHAHEKRRDEETGSPGLVQPGRVGRHEGIRQGRHMDRPQDRRHPGADGDRPRQLLGHLPDDILHPDPGRGPGLRLRLHPASGGGHPGPVQRAQEEAHPAAARNPRRGLRAEHRRHEHDGRGRGRKRRHGRHFPRTLVAAHESREERIQHPGPDPQHRRRYAGGADQRLRAPRHHGPGELERPGDAAAVHPGERPREAVRGPEELSISGQPGAGVPLYLQQLHVRHAPPETEHRPEQGGDARRAALQHLQHAADVLRDRLRQRHQHRDPGQQGHPAVGLGVPKHHRGREQSLRQQCTGCGRA